MLTGVVKWFDDKKGFGFIAGDDGQDIFVHYSGIVGTGYRTLEANMAVEYEIEDTPRGAKAINVQEIKRVQ